MVLDLIPFSGVGEFFGKTYSDWLHETPANRVAIAATFVLPLFGWFLSWSKLARRSKAIEGLEATIALERQEKETLKNDRDAARTECAAVLAQYNPQSWLDKAARETRDNNVLLAHNALAAGFDNVAHGLGQTCAQMAQFYSAQVDDAQDGPTHLVQAARLAQIASLLNPADQTSARLAQTMIAEQEKRGLPDALDTSANARLPTDPAQARAQLQGIRTRGAELFAQGEYATCVEIYEHGMHIARHAGVLRENIGLVYWYYFAQALSFAGKRQAALQQMRELLPLMEKVLGEEHPDTLNTRNLQAQVLSDLGETETVLAKVKELLPLQEKVLGEEHPNTLATRYLQAQVLSNLGQYQTALAKVEELLPLLEKVLGPEHPNTLTTRYWQAQIFRGLGQKETALAKLEELLPLREKVLGPEHPQTENVREDIAYLQKKTQSATFDQPAPAEGGSATFSVDKGTVDFSAGWGNTTFSVQPSTAKPVQKNKKPKQD